MSKYTFHELKKMTSLPDDVNSICLVALKKLDPTGKAVDFFIDKQNKKLFGTFNVINENTGRLTASFEMHFGIVKMFKLIEFLGDSATHFYRTVLNDNVSFENKKGVKNDKTI